VTLHHGFRCLAEAAWIRIEGDDLDTVRRERTRDRQTRDVAVEHEGAG